MAAALWLHDGDRSTVEGYRRHAARIKGDDLALPKERQQRRDAALSFISTIG
jgi:hypothetical protein